MSQQIQLRRGTAAEWAAANPVLAEAEPGYETDTGKEKRGDGATAWNSLGYLRGTSAPSWSIKTASDSPLTATAGAVLMIDTTDGAFTLNLPAAPLANDTVTVCDYAGTFETHNTTIARNGKLIMGAAADMAVSTNFSKLTLTYIDSTRGWILT